MRKGFFKGLLLGLTLAGLALFATTALAGSGIGGVFNLGQVNTVDNTSNLNGTATNAMLDVANSGTGANSNGIVGRTASTLAPALAGVNSGAGIGARGTSVSGSGIYGQSTSGPGARGISASGRGVHGTHSGTTGTAAGVYGETSSTDANASGSSGTVLSTAPGAGSAGVRGINNGTGFDGYGVFGSHAGGGIGVYGTTNGGTAVQGHAPAGYNGGFFDSGSSGGNGVVGEADTGTNAYGVWGVSNQGDGGNFTGGNHGVYASSGNIGVEGSGGNFGGEFSSGPGYGVYGHTDTGTNGGFFTSGGSGGNGVVGIANNGSNAYGVEGSSTSGSGVVGFGPVNGVRGSSAATGVRGNGGPTGVGGVGTSQGVFGSNSSGTAGDGVAGNSDTGAGSAGVRGTSTAPGGNGVIGASSNSAGSTPYGVWGLSGTGGWAGVFSGDVLVTGAISAGTKDFRIDNPLDPSHSYLQHASVESNQMKNVYDGTVTTDSHGFATVKLPSYFQALNGNFRYQLTILGRSFAQAIVWDKISHNRFTIRTNQPNTEVSWQVTGIRHDRYAIAHPLKVILPKSSHEQGFYLHPELYGKSATKSIEAADKPGAFRAMASRPSSAPSLKPTGRAPTPGKAPAQPRQKKLKH